MFTSPFRFTTGAAIVLALLAATPSAVLASWGGKGELEPNTPYDATPAYMWQQPYSSPMGERVYFDGFLGEGRAPDSCGINRQSGLATCLPCHDDYTLIGLGYWGACVEPSVSPNVGALGTGVPLDPYTPMAVLGVWKDCNKDGYIGWGDQGLTEYRSELLLDASACPVRATPTVVPYDWFPAHNDGAWVRELLPIGWDRQREFLDAQGNSIDENIYDVNDSSARVWADAGAPGAPVHTYCHLEPLPAGTLRRTGTLLSTADCAAGYEGTTIIDAALEGAGLPEYSFGDAAPGHAGDSSSPLNVANPYGNSSEASYVSIYDCAAPPVTTADAGGFHWVGVPTPTLSPSVQTQGASPGGTVGYLISPFVLPSTTGSCGGIRWPADYAMYGLESARAANRFAVRDQTDFPMHYVMGERPNHPLGLLGKAYERDMGTRHVESWGYWTADNALDLASDPFITRDGLSIARPLSLTYYAFVGAGAQARYNMAVPSSAVGSYGAEACLGSTNGPHNGWQCDAAAWWPDGIPTTGAIETWHQVPYAPRVGAQYNLRDVDCYDASANGARGLGISYGTITGTSC